MVVTEGVAERKKVSMWPSTLGWIGTSAVGVAGIFLAEKLLPIPDKSKDAFESITAIGFIALSYIVAILAENLALRRQTTLPAI